MKFDIAALKNLHLRDRWADAPYLVRIVGMLALIAVFFYLPFVNRYPFAYIRTDLDAGGSDWASVLFVCALYAIVAVGLNIVIGLAGLLDLGYVGFYALGAYTVALFGSPSSPVTQKIASTFGWSEGWTVPFVLCIPLAIALCLSAGVILGAPTLRLRGDYLAIVTMGFGEIIRIVARNSEFTGGPSGIIGVPKPPGPQTDGREFFNQIDAYRWYWLALVVLIILIMAVRRLESSRVGRSWLAIREDEDAAQIMGVPGFKFKLLAFATGASIGGLAGLLFGSKTGVVEPNGFALNLSFLFVAMVVIGGSGNMAGAILGAFLLTYLPERLRSLPVIGDSITLYRPLIFGLALVIIMIQRPQGLVPNRRRARELSDRKIEAEEAAADV